MHGTERSVSISSGHTRIGFVIVEGSGVVASPETDVAGEPCQEMSAAVMSSVTKSQSKYETEPMEFNVHFLLLAMSRS